MKTLLRQARFRGAIGLIAAYAIALQAVFAAFAPVPVGASGPDFGQVICFGSGNASPGGSDPAAPAPASGKFHCVLCGSVLAGAAVLPEPAAGPAIRSADLAPAFAVTPDLAPAPHSVRAGAARAPPMTV